MLTAAMLSGQGADMAPSAPGNRLQLVVTPEFLAAVDDWRRKQPDLPNRSEAIRRMVEQVSRNSVQKPSASVSDGGCETGNGKP